MKAAVLTDLLKIEIRDVPEPKIERDNEVLIRVKSVGVCGSDIHYYKTGRIGSQVVEFPFIVGHECSGVIEKTGKGVQALKKGMRVAVDPAISCWRCDQCRGGRPHTCRNLRFLGCPGQAEGSLCEYIVMPEESIYPVSDDITFEQATLAEPLSIGVYATHLSIHMEGARVGVLGFGPIGMSVAYPALWNGADKVYVTDKVPERIKTAAAIPGIGYAGHPDKDNVVEEILKLAPKGLDCVFECCGEQAALDQAIELLKPGGKLMLIGIPETDRISFIIDKMRRKEICVQNVRRQLDCVRPALDLIADKVVDITKMITHRYPLEKTKEAFDLVMNYEDGVMKAMIEL